MTTLELDNLGITVSAYELPPELDEQAYLNDVGTNLHRISLSATGRAIFTKILAHGKVLITPFTAEVSRRTQSGSCNSVTESVTLKPSHRIATVSFTPAIYRTNSPCARSHGREPDPVLLHELVHAGRKLGFDAKQVPLTGRLAPYDNEEEFFAILVENIYISESGRINNIGLRSGHSSTAKMDQIDEAVFLSDPDVFNLVKKFCDQHTTIAPMIGKATGEFNPIRKYYEWDEEMPEYPIFHPKAD